MRHKTALIAATVLTIAGATVAIAQPGSPVDPEQGSEFGACVAEASEAGAENPAAACEDLRPGPPNGGDDDPNGENGENGEDEGRGEAGLAAECEGESKEDGSFGRCVADHASAFGQCVSANAEAGVENPTAACAELRPGPPEGTGNGPPEGISTGPPEGTPSGPPEGTPSGPPEGTPSGPPEGTPSGPPEGTPAGPPEGTPSGPPEGTPNGPPEGTPGGRP